MKVSAIQMDMRLGDPDYNFAHAVALIRQAAQQKPDVITLPETWNVGFFPKENLAALSDCDGARVKSVFGPLAQELGVNIIAGSVANQKDGKIFNTAHIFDRNGKLVADYDKTHLFTPMGEDNYFENGSRVVHFELDGVRCGIVICYDIRFLELVRTLALQKIDVLFVVAQWPDKRVFHWNILNRARAIENQMFVVCTNSCGLAGDTRYGGNSALIDPWGETIATAGTGEEIITGELDMSIITGIRESINVFRDRRPALYKVN